MSFNNTASTDLYTNLSSFSVAVEDDYGLETATFSNPTPDFFDNQKLFLESNLLATEDTTVAPNYRQIVFIDDAVRDEQTLIDDISGASDVIVLGNDVDGMVEMTQRLSQYEEIDAVHIISHGDAGQLFLGNTTINSQNLTEYEDLLQEWTNFLADDADLILYGCNTALGLVGESFLAELSALTEADILASDDLTGSSELGGNWDLEASFGEIEAKTIFSPQLEATYQDVFRDVFFPVF